MTPLAAILNLLLNPRLHPLDLLLGHPQLHPLDLLLGHPRLHPLNLRLVHPRLHPLRPPPSRIRWRQPLHLRSRPPYLICLLFPTLWISRV